LFFIEKEDFPQGKFLNVLLKMISLFVLEDQTRSSRHALRGRGFWQDTE